MKTYIIGHTKPDTDAVVATLALKDLYQHADCFGYSDPTPLIADPLNPETTFLFTDSTLTPPQHIDSVSIEPTDQCILVDHNEVSQRATQFTSEQVVEIIDHHKINLNQPAPMYATFKPWGSTCTIIFHLMEQSDHTPNQELSRLMLASILSDTVGFKSATTTSKDREVATKLATLANVSDIDDFTLQIFKAKSDLSQLTPTQIVTNDYKIFDFTQKTLINQVETVEQEVILSTQKDVLLAAMAEVKTTQAVGLIFVAISDILNVNTKLLILSDAEAQVATKAFGGTVIDHVLDIGPKLSRKKEIAPAIEAALKP